jgi:hypothetical protein
LRSSVLLLDRGSLLFKGDLDELRTHWDRPRYHIEFRGEDHAATALTRLVPDIAVEAIVGSAVLVQIPADMDLGAALHRLGPLASAITTIQDAPMPLRELLMRIYEAPTGQEAATASLDVA